MQTTRLLLLISVTALLGLFCVAGCPKAEEQSAGSFDKPEDPQPGVRVKPEAEAPPGPPDFTNAFSIASAFDKANKEVRVTLEVKEGFHAYAVGETTGVPVAFNVSNENGWSVDGDVKMPKGKEKTNPDGSKSVVLQGKVPVSAKLKGGAGDVVGGLKVQVCSESSCDRPRTHPIRVPTT